MSRVAAELIVRSGACLEGNFLLKDGSPSDFFVDIGRIIGWDLHSLAELVAAELDALQPLDVLVAPPYKAIPLVSVVSALTNLPFDFYRKEAKDHGEKGLWVTKTLQPHCLALIVDDVYTAGLTIREALRHIREAEAVPVGVFVVVDRIEKSTRIDGIPIYSLTSLSEVRSAYRKKKERPQELYR